MRERSRYLGLLPNGSLFSQNAPSLQDLDPTENKMKVQLYLAIALAFLLAPFGLAQSDTPGHEVSIGYSFLHDNFGNDRNGFVASFSERMKDRLWIKAEVSGNYQHELLLGARQVDFVHAVLAGPEFKFRKDAKLIPWAHFLIGMTINNRPEVELGTPFFSFRRNSDIGFGFQPGGGVDYYVSQRFAIRLGADYRHAYSGFNGNDFLRLHGGVTVRF